MNKPLVLGNIAVSFHHGYKPVHQVNKKTGMTSVVGKPISTNVTVESTFGKATSSAKCSSKDTFDYETGRKVSLRKALDTISASLEPEAKKAFKEQRTEMWNMYNKLKQGGRW
jgi:hypothetical protein